jgi:hypothetical protein
MLICAAGPRPATMRLASITAQGLRSTQDRYRLRQPRITKVSTSPAPAPLIIAIGLIKSRPPLSASTSNPHSAQRSSRIHSRGFFLWRLSDAGPKPPSSAHRPSSAGIRNPSQKQTHALQQMASYSINSSARSRKASEIVSPSTLAILRLITSSYLVGCSTGRSAGLSPLRMRAT